jgi:alpha-tubulin suppressor-like RCC1 family protein
MTGPKVVPDHLLVSNPHVLSATLTPSRVTTLAVTADAVGEDTMVYVALEPGTAPTGVTATVRGVASGATATTAVQNGGFDPVPVTAYVGDTVVTAVRDASGAVVFTGHTAVVPARRLRVVRTDPAPGKRDQPLNASIVIVFSEPVASGSLTATSVQLSSSSTTVPGTVSLLPGSGTTVVFTPDAPLAPNTNYLLLITTTVTDLDGQPLAEAVSVSFTTGVASTGQPATISVSPNAIQMTGGTYQLTATVRDAAQTVLVGLPVTWTSSDPNGLTVSATGLVTARTTGSYVVTAASSGLNTAAQVVVAAGPPAAVTIAPTPASVGAQGDTIILSATVRDSRDRVITYPSMTWRSNAPTVATVAAYNPGDVPPGYATVTGVSLGEATITATSGTASGTALVTVTTPRPVGSVTVTPSSVALLARMTKRLFVAVRDDNGKVLPGRPVAWTTGAASIATVDASGLVGAVDSGSTVVIATSGGVSDSAAITVVALRMGAVVAGGSHSCALTTGGAAYCWGGNAYGQVGDGSELSRLLPTAVTGALTFAALSAGSYHSCGLTIGGNAYCWGDNENGELGDGNAPVRSPVPVAVLANSLTFSVLVIGAYHTCGLAPGGAAYCWGYNGDGELGDGSFNSSSVPVAVTGGHTFSALSARALHTCGIASGGTLYCWGFNRNGELGDGTRSSRAVPTAVPGRTFSAVSANATQTCGTTTGGPTYCWGNAALDTLNPTPPNPPTLVGGGRSFVALAAGDQHTCGLIALGTAYCWGGNFSGQLGDGSTTDRSVPVAVSGGLSFSALSGGGAHTCGFTSGGVAFCWGENSSAQVGDGSQTSSSIPLRVAGQP